MKGYETTEEYVKAVVEEIAKEKDIDTTNHLISLLLEYSNDEFMDYIDEYADKYGIELM